MTKKRLLALLLIGILTGLLLSACAGVAAGKVEWTTPGEVFTGGPLLDVQSIPFLEVAQPGHSAQFTFEKAAIVNSVLEDVAQSQMQIRYNMLCSGAGH